jgi:hypothetical protein
MRCARNDLELFRFRRELRERGWIHPDDRDIIAANDQQRWRFQASSERDGQFVVDVGYARRRPRRALCRPTIAE